MNAGDEVAIRLPGVSFALYGTVVSEEGDRLTVRVVHDGEHAVITIDAEAVKPWRARPRRVS